MQCSLADLLQFQRISLRDADDLKTQITILIFIFALTRKINFLLMYPVYMYM
jgi:hypothetical protein